MSARAKARPLSDRLAALGSAVVTAQQRVRECDLAERHAAAEVARLQDALIDAYASDDEQRAAKATRERDKAETTLLRDAKARHEGAKRALQRAEVERSTFAVENLPGLIAERRPDAMAAAAAVEASVEALGRANAQWAAVNQDVAALLRLAGRDTRDMPSFPERLLTLVQDARRAGSVDVPPPLPRGHAAVPAQKPSRAREAA